MEVEVDRLVGRAGGLNSFVGVDVDVSSVVLCDVDVGGWGAMSVEVDREVVEWRVRVIVVVFEPFELLALVTFFHSSLSLFSLCVVSCREKINRKKKGRKKTYIPHQHTHTHQYNTHPQNPPHSSYILRHTRPRIHQRRTVRRDSSLPHCSPARMSRLGRSSWRGD